jgi:hypothetical protein
MPRIISARITRRVVGRAAALGLCLGAAGLAACNDVITGEGLTTDPNNPVTADALQLFVGAQASLILQQEAQLPRIAAMWTQQIAGINNQQQTYGSQYQLPEDAFNTYWNQVYTGGGLYDLRQIRTLGAQANDQKYQGLALFMEAFRMGVATSFWGDIPYREATDVNFRTPKLDPQEQIYADVQAKLDTAITLLGGTGTGPAAQADVFYQGDWNRWIRAAYTLKARFHMHTAERLGAPAYQAALAAAQRGINEAPTTAAQAIHGQAPGDFRPTHGNTTNDGNIWAQFQLGTRQDITAAQFMISLLESRNDPRLAAYFDPASGTAYRGADQFGRTPAGGTSNLDRETRTVLTFRQPFITWAENQLIIAEASLALGTGNPLANLNAVRTAVGLPALAGPATLAEIATEKYIVNFQNTEALPDYRRTCFPRITPGGANNTSAAEIPTRLPYALTERQANPNIPAPNAAPARMWSDPNPCPRP